MPGPLARSAEALLLVAAGLLSLLLLANLLDYGYGRDQGIYAVVADAIQRGGAPYRDAWDFKPPGIFFAFTLAELAFGSGERAVRVLEALALASLFPAFAILSSRGLGSRRAGWLGASCALLAYVPLEWWHTAQPEGFGGVLLAWALVCAHGHPAAPGEGRRELVGWCAAAALYALAALFKPPLGGGILASYAFALAGRLRGAQRGQRLRAAVAPTVAFAVGGALPVLAALAWFGARGALADLGECLFSFAPRYVALSYQTDRLPALLATALREWLFRMTPFHLVGLLPLLLLPPIHPRERSGALHVLSVVAFSLLGVALQARFFHYHYGASVLLTGLLAGWGYWKLWLRMRESAPTAAAVLGLIALLALTGLPGSALPRVFLARSLERAHALADPELRTPTRDRLYSIGDVDRRENRRAAAWIASHTPAASRLFVWGFQPVLYDWSERRPASRYIYTAPQRAEWSARESRAQLIAELTAARPAAVVVVHADRAVFATVTGRAVDSSEALTQFPELARLLDAGYGPGARIGDLEIRTRRGPRTRDGGGPP